MLNRIALSLTASVIVCFLIGSAQVLTQPGFASGWMTASAAFLFLACPVYFAVFVRAFVRVVTASARQKQG